MTAIFSDTMLSGRVDVRLTVRKLGKKSVEIFVMRQGEVSCVVGGCRRAVGGCLPVKAAAFLGCVARPVVVRLMGW